MEGTGRGNFWLVLGDVSRVRAFLEQPLPLASPSLVEAFGGNPGEGVVGRFDQRGPSGILQTWS